MSSYIKFECKPRGDGRPIASFEGFGEISLYRQKLLQLGLIGVDANGIGFGNLSIRCGNTEEFCITGSATTRLTELAPRDCAKVIAHDFDQNWVRYEGSVLPSSESLTHAAVYQSSRKISAIIHCHDSELWSGLLREPGAISPVAQYGTPEMAYEILRLFRNIDVKNRGILAMAGHEGGVIAFGENLDQAFAILMCQREKRSARGRSRCDKRI